MEKNNYREQMLEQISEILEKVGGDDEKYNNAMKSLDIIETLEILLAYTIFGTTNSTEGIRDSAEESYFNIKRRAVLYHKQNKEIEREKTNNIKPKYEKLPMRS